MLTMQDELENYLSQYPKVKIIRSKDRIGLIRYNYAQTALATLTEH